jgi:potassium-transporting ATPase KdpC subunit
MTPEDASSKEAGSPGPPPAVAEIRFQVRPLLVGLVLLTLLTAVAFPAGLYALAHLLFPRQANGSLITRDGDVVGSELIGQRFTADGYFHPRPSSAGEGYDATASGGSNLGPANPQLRRDVARLAAAYRRANGLPADAAVPVDAVTRSGSGLDPHISPANAELQAARVAQARGLSVNTVRRLVAEHTAGRQLGVLGEPRVNVLELNLALDAETPAPAEAPDR